LLLASRLGTETFHEDYCHKCINLIPLDREIRDHVTEALTKLGTNAFSATPIIAMQWNRHLCRSLHALESKRAVMNSDTTALSNQFATMPLKQQQHWEQTRSRRTPIIVMRPNRQ
jgi:hypothetical protein